LGQTKTGIGDMAFQSCTPLRTGIEGSYLYFLTHPQTDTPGPARSLVRMEALIDSCAQAARGTRVRGERAGERGVNECNRLVSTIIASGGTIPGPKVSISA